MAIPRTTEPTLHPYDAPQPRGGNIPERTTSERTSPESTALDRSDNRAIDDLYAAAIGPVHTAYYSSLFQRFETTDRTSPHWNWAAGLCTLGWLAFRQLWGAALAYASAVATALLLVWGVGRLLFQLNSAAESALLAAMATLVIAIPGLWGNVWFYASCRKKIQAALSANPTLAQTCAALQAQASGPLRLRWVAGLVVFAYAAIAALFLVFFFSFRTAAPNATSPASPSTTAAATSGKVSSKPAVPALPVIPASAPAVAPAVISSAPATSASASASASAPALSASATAPIPTQTPQPAARPTPAPPQPQANRIPATPAIKATPTPARNPAPVAATKKTEREKAASTRQFFINVGLFADVNNARNARAKISDAGLTAFTQTLRTPQGPRTRVRCGPYATQAEADRAADTIRALRLDAIVFSQ